MTRPAPIASSAGAGRLHVCFDGVMDAARSGGWQVLVNCLRELAQIDSLSLSVIAPGERVEEIRAVSAALTVIPVTTSPRQPLRNVLWHLARLPRIVSRLRPDVLHVPSHNLLVSRRVVPTVLTIHDVTEFSLRGHYDRARTLYRHRVVPRNARLVDHIVTVSAFVAADITATLGVPPDKISVAHNGVSADYVPSPVPGNSCFLYLGQIHLPNKNLLRLVDAYALLRQRHPEAPPLVIAGKDVVGADAVRRQIALHELGNHVAMPGYQPRSELPALYQRALCLVYPPLREGFGLPVVEAMASGCPVITSHTSSLIEIASGAAVLVDPESTEAIAAAMARVLLSTTLRAQLRAQGIERARQFTWQRSAAVLHDVYRRVARLSPDARTPHESA